MRDIRTEIDRINELIPFPGVLSEILAELSADNFVLPKIIRLIEADAVLITSMLRVVNSPFFGVRHKVDSIRNAVSLLGLRETTSVVVALDMKRKMMNMNPAQSARIEQLWQHSIATASIAKIIAQFLRISPSHKEFTASVLHDMSKLVLIQYFPKELDLVERMIGELNIRDFEAESQVVAIAHTEIGHLLGKKWNLPQEYVEVMHMHHDPLNAKLNPHLVAVVSMADLLANQWGYRIPETPPEIVLQEELPWKALMTLFPTATDQGVTDFMSSIYSTFESQGAYQHLI